MFSLRKPSWLPVLLLLGLLVGAEAREYRRALPGYAFQFPRDHFSHPGFKTEWWYYTGHLRTSDGRRYGYQVTFFRAGTAEGRSVANPSRWTVRDLFLAHFAISDLNRQRFHFTDRLNRAALGTAGASTTALRVWNGDWRLDGDGDTHRLRAKDDTYAVDLTLTPVKPPVIHGKGGVSQKGEGAGYASHYYSLTRLQTAGTMTVNGRAGEVHGWSWMDHEFGSNQLREDHEGWDWFGLQLDQDVELMFYVMRQKGGHPDPHSSGTLILPDGTSLPLILSQVDIRQTGTWKSPRSKATYPMGWEIRIPRHHVFLTVTPSFPDQELDTRKSTQVIYWEGSVAVSGTYQGTAITGQGYVELTGYAGKFNTRI
ncbi:MAG: lipocalin-like domain-containing protein [Candidatus Methylomirabilales bacterium]